MALLLVLFIGSQPFPSPLGPVVGLARVVVPCVMSCPKGRENQRCDQLPASSQILPAIRDGSIQQKIFGDIIVEQEELANSFRGNGASWDVHKGRCGTVDLQKSTMAIWCET